MKKLKIICLTFLTLLLLSLGFACFGSPKQTLYTLTVSDEYGHITSPLKTKYRGGEEVSVTVHDMYSGIRVELYLDDELVEDREALEYPYVRFRFTMPYRNAELCVSPPYHPDDTNGNGSSSGDSSNGNSSSGDFVDSSDILQSSAGPEPLNAYTFSVTYDYWHVEGEATLLYGYCFPFFDPTVWGIEPPLLAGDELTVYYTGGLCIDESYPGAAYIVDGGSIQWVEKTKTAKLYSLNVKDGVLYTADGLRVGSEHEYVVNRDGSLSKISELSDGTQLYGSSTEFISCDGGAARNDDVYDDANPRRYHAIYSYDPRYPLAASDVLDWISDLQPSYVSKIESEIFNGSVSRNDFIAIKTITFETEIEKFVSYLKNLKYIEYTQNLVPDGSTTAIYTLYTVRGVIKYTTYAGLYSSQYKIFKPNRRPPELAADEDATTYRFKRCFSICSLYINGDYVKDYGTLLQNIVFKPAATDLNLEDYSVKYVLDGYDIPVYVYDEKTFWFEEGFQKGVYEIVGETDFSQIFKDYPKNGDKTDATKRALTVTGNTEYLIKKPLSAYAAGENVTVVTDILMDAYIAMYLNGEYIGSGTEVEIDGRSCSAYSFTMPDCDSVLFAQVENGFLPPTENVDFSARILLHCDFSGFEEGITLLSTASQHTAFFKDAGEDLRDFTKKYDDAYFTENSLLVFCLTETSGSIRHEVTSVEITFGENRENVVTVNLKRSVPEVCTCDMADWIIFIEIPKYARIETGTFNVKIDNCYTKDDYA